MALEALQSEEAKKEIVTGVWGWSNAISLHYDSMKKQEIENEHLASADEAEKDLDAFLNWDEKNIDIKKDKKEQKKEQKDLAKEEKQEDKFKEDIKEVWTTATAYMGNGDFQKALDVLYPVLEKNKDFVTDKFAMDINANVWQWNMSYNYGPSYQFLDPDGKEIKDYIVWMKNIYQQISNQEWPNKWKDLWIATLAMQFLSNLNRNSKFYKMISTENNEK